MKPGVEIKDLAKQVRGFANFEDAKFFLLGSKLWQYQDKLRILEAEVIQPWEMPTKESCEKAEKLYLERLKSVGSNPGTNLKIGQEEVSFFDFERVNEFLLPEYFYFAGLLFEGKRSFLLGKVEEQRKTKIGESEVVEFFIGDELVCNLPFSASTFTSSAGEDFVVGRIRSQQGRTWGWVLGAKKSLLNPFATALLFNTFSYLGLEKRDILNGSRERIAVKVDEVARKELEVCLAHERGHVFERQKCFPLDVYEGGVRCAQKQRDVGLECFFRAVSDSFADNAGEGAYPFILSLKEPDRTGLLNLAFLNVMLPGAEKQSALVHNNLTLGYLSKLEEGFWLSAFPLYSRTGDVGILEDACRGVCEKSGAVVEQLAGAGGSYDELKKVQEAFDKRLCKNLK